MEYETPQKLYHYCSLSTFYNIVKNQSIWVSDVQKSNDFLEVIWLKQLFTKKMNEELYKFQLKLVNDSKRIPSEPSEMDSVADITLTPLRFSAAL